MDNTTYNLLVCYDEGLWEYRVDDNGDIMEFSSLDEAKEEMQSLISDGYLPNQIKVVHEIPFTFSISF